MASSFNLDAFKAIFPDIKDGSPRDCYVTLARTAEGAERYEEMCQFMKELVCNHDANLNEDERNLLSVAYKNVIGAKRASWRTMKTSPLESSVETDSTEKKLTEQYCAQVERELKEVCDEVLHLLESKLIPAASDFEDSVFYKKMAGDYCRYLAESSDSEEDKQLAAKYYKDAFAVAEAELRATHPIRLGLALNYSVCFYEILKDKHAACELAKRAFDEAISKLDKLQTTEYKDSTLIMQLLRDNLTLWTSNSSDDGNDDEEVAEYSDGDDAA